MQSKGFAYNFPGFCTRRRVGMKPCLLEANTVHCGGLERLGSSCVDISNSCLRETLRAFCDPSSEGICTLRTRAWGRTLTQM